MTIDTDKNIKNMNKSHQKCLENTLKRINSDYVKLKKKDTKSNTATLFAVLEQIIEIMKSCDPLFCNMKPKLEYLGSYFDGLRVGEPNEYDINLKLSLPVNYDKIILDAKVTNHDYTSILMPSEFRRLLSNTETVNKGFLKTKSWCNSNYRLSVKVFRSWMQSVVDAALNTLPLRNEKRIIEVNNREYEITAKNSGPANTITIMTPSDISSLIDIDLVPTFEFSLPKKPKCCNINFDAVEKTKIKNYFVVPKPTGCDVSWRLSFPLQERHYIKNKNNLKSVLKLIKLFRDAQRFKPLASYFIKTVFLWECSEQKDSFWKHNSLGFLLIYMLKKLRDCLAKEEIKNFWCPQSNLIKGKINSETCRNWSNRMSNIIAEIEQRGNGNPEIMLQYFSVK